MPDPVRIEAPQPTTFSYIQWGPIFVGALAAAALALVLHAFAGAIGLAVSSTAPTWRDASVALWILSGLYLVLVALASYGLGGYLAGRLRTHLALASADEVEFRDGCHGLAVWALATILTGLVIAISVAAASRLAVPSSGTVGPASSTGGETVIAFDLDKLFRAERRPDAGDLAYNRAEAARILLTASGHAGVASEDRSYLIRLVGSRTGLAQPDAERRVDATIASARSNIARARQSAVILAFMVGAAALLGAAAAWFAACAGGRHREQAPKVRWGAFGPRVVR